MRPIALLSVVLLGAGCIDEPGEFRYGTPIWEVELVLTGPTMGVDPDTSMLDVDENPFPGAPGEARWELLADSQFVGSFYAWGSTLAVGPYGEAQFYTALSAHSIYDLELTDTEDLVWMREIAIGGYQRMLDEWPDAVTYDITGTIAYPLAPSAVQGIQALGGRVEGGWILIENDEGEVVAVQP